jgi:hypothetical protein
MMTEDSRKRENTEVPGARSETAENCAQVHFDLRTLVVALFKSRGLLMCHTSSCESEGVSMSVLQLAPNSL